MTILASPKGTPFNTEIDRLRERNTICQHEGIRLSILTKSGTLTDDPHTAVELCQSVKGLGITLDPSYYVCRPGGVVDYDVVYPHVLHLHLRDTSLTELQVLGGLGEVDYNRIVAMLRQFGYQRSLSNRGEALLAGRRIAVAGRVTMDMTMFDVTDTDADLGDVVTLLGRQGDDVITVSEMATRAGLSPYEILTGLRLRLPRRYAEGEREVVAA